jgi:hypothetical protein
VSGLSHDARLFFIPLIPAKAGTQAFLLETPRSRIKNLDPRIRGDERGWGWPHGFQFVSDKLA